MRDALALVAALGHTEVPCVIGRDFGAPVAGNCALTRPDVFRSVVMMSAPYGGPRAWPLGEQAAPEGHPASPIQRFTRPRPARSAAPALPVVLFEARGRCRYAPRAAGAARVSARLLPPQERADWAGNKPYPLAAWTAEALAALPTYYVMPAGIGMAETVAAEMPDAARIAANTWLPDAALAVYAEEYGRTGFQGGLQSYRCTTSGQAAAEMRLSSPGAASTCPPASSPAAATGASTRNRASSS